MKIVFDASIHLGQFDFAHEEKRRFAKASQASLSLKPEAAVVGFVTYEENSKTDDIIWDIE